MASAVIGHCDQKKPRLPEETQEGISAEVFKAKLRKGGEFWPSNTKAFGGAKASRQNEQRRENLARAQPEEGSGRLECDVLEGFD